MLILHGLAAVFLVGAISHQATSLLRTGAPVPQRGFVGRFAAVRAGGYTGAIVALYLATLLLGAMIYPDYALGARATIRADWPGAFAAFEIKEHFAALGLGLLPAYWALWRGQVPQEQSAVARRTVTVLLALIVWVAFLVGHVLNNLEGI